MLNRILSLLLFLSTLIFIILVTALPVNNPDIWYHLKVGEWIWENRAIPKKDFFSFTAEGREWIAQWWFYDVIVYFLQSHFGFQSLVYLKITIALLIFFFLLKTLRFYLLPNSFSLPLLVFSFLIISTAWVDRPHVFSYLFVVVLMWILISYQFGKKKTLLFIPPLFFLWANIHASIPLALILVIFLILSEIWKKIAEGKRELGKILPSDLILIFLLGAVASFINPNTYKTHLYVFKIDPQFVSSNIVEWIPLSNFFADWHIQLFLFFGFLSLFSFCFVLLRPPKEKTFQISLFELLITFSLFYLSFSALRFAPVFVLLILPFMAKNTFLVTNRVWLRMKKKWPPIRGYINSFLILVILTLCFLNERGIKGHHFGVEMSALPVEAAEFIDRNNPPPFMFHVFNWGGYLIWRLYPKYKVFIDGRLAMYVPDIYNEWLQVALARENWREILEKYKINFCLISNEPEWNRLGRALEEDPNWVLVYWDNMAGIFLKKEEKNRNLLERYGMEAVAFYHPTIPYKEGKEEEAEKEYLEFLQRYPQRSAVYNKLGVLYFLTNRKEKAKEYLQKALAINPFYATAYFNLGLVVEEEGDYNQAISLFQKARKYAPRFPEVYKKLGYIYSRKLKYKDEARFYFQKYLQLAGNPPDRRSIEAELEK